MKLSYSWLKEFVAVKGNAESLAERLTMSGFEVEGVTPEGVTPEGISSHGGDKILEINVTANRGDALSVLGIAREVSALYRLPLKKKNTKPLSLQKKKGPITLSVQSHKKCPRYALVVLKGVKVAPSPEWLAQRLSAVGMRSINNIVDVTNYVLMECGQPLHAFDLRQIRDGKIIVRTATENEIMITLDGEERKLTPDDLVIADPQGVLAIAGVMGGRESEITDQTTDIAIESAFFDPASIRKTSRRLGLQTDSSYRFERRVDPEGTLLALERAVQLIQELAGGMVVGDLDKRSSQDFCHPPISFSPQEVQETLGGEWPSSLVKKVFQQLSFQVKEKTKGRWEIRIPSYRGDIEKAVDLIEEVARVAGLDKIPTSFPALESSPLKGSLSYLKERKIRQLLVSFGFREAIHFSFLSPDELSLLASTVSAQLITLENPLSHEYSVMRPTLLTSLIKTAAFHHRHKIFSLRLFEMRSVFEKNGEGIRERKVLSGLLSGDRVASHWSVPKKEKGTDFFDLKGIVQAILDESGLSEVSFQPSDSPLNGLLHPGKRAEVKVGATQVGGKTVGVLGEIHPEAAHQFEIKTPTFVFELDTALLFEKVSTAHFEEYSKFPVVDRDLAIVVPREVPAGSIQEFISKQDEEIKGVTLFDLYQGAPVPEGKKSLAFSIQLAHKDRTLTDEEVNAIFGRVTEGVKLKFQAEIR
ncbi:MAG: phenylalanine--tRNA ligase subunit beta [Deltaproteobacteria bacterium]|nr:phenylalanine--tRNA ligase subunit beta [Deltaproteobacteria bacterium]